ncbi:RNA polymerase sigma factor [Hymenobacter sp. GOD-10R]|uniref:RNA polymerase sigma factor n=1 Tax=Hymenobacter sp. GOD-10R TaxID=3093922 RepID=UPI002D78205A|nr:sigma-70 family RNA polymerase sigma factor [Hymenobacter sp. GOD-10R]WRQ26718.1 sigma-70 family RNA polymerase sigma factor [Hymenobacter sp. GOD-10R]
MSQQPPSFPTDQNLVNRVLAGNAVAFGEIVKRTEGLVTQLVFKMIRHPADRPDLVQDVYLKAFSHLASFQFQAKLSTWIGQIAYNTCLHYLEKKRLVLIDYTDPSPPEGSHTRDPTTWPADTPAVETLLASQDRADVLAAAIDQLSPLYRTLIGLYHQQELSYAEIAQITSLPDGTVKNYLFRARKQLKDIILRTYQRDEL